MAIIGRMVVEKQQLDRRGVALHEELRNIAKGLQSIATTLENSGSIYSKDFVRLTDEQSVYLNARRITTLLNEIEESGKRYQEISTALKRAGF